MTGPTGPNPWRRCRRPPSAHPPGPTPDTALFDAQGPSQPDERWIVHYGTIDPTARPAQLVDGELTALLRLHRIAHPTCPDPNDLWGDDEGIHFLWGPDDADVFDRWPGEWFALTDTPDGFTVTHPIDATRTATRSISA